MDAFTSDIKHSRLFSLETADVDELADAYNAMSEVLDKHAPVKKKTVTIHPVAPWYNDDIGAAKKERRHAERVWRTSGLTVHEQIYHDAKSKVTEMIANSKQEYYKERINSADDAQKALFACVKELLHGNKSTGLPSCDSAQDLSERIATFFKDKISKIRSYLEQIQEEFPTEQIPETLLVSDDELLTSFDPATEEEVKKIITSSAPKSCCLDLMPIHILKKCLDVLLP